MRIGFKTCATCFMGSGLPFAGVSCLETLMKDSYPVLLGQQTSAMFCCPRSRCRKYSCCNEGYCLLRSVKVYLIIAEHRRPEGLPSGAPYPYGKHKETHELIFSWLSRLAVLLVGAYARRRRSRATWRL